MGGAAQGQLPAVLRISALIQAAMNAGMAIIVLARAELNLPGWFRVSRWLIWLVLAILGLSPFFNLITPSAGERAIWAPALLVLLVTSTSLALSSRSSMQSVRVADR